MLYLDIVVLELRYFICLLQIYHLLKLSNELFMGMPPILPLASWHELDMPLIDLI